MGASDVCRARLAPLYHVSSVLLRGWLSPVHYFHGCVGGEEREHRHTGSLRKARLRPSPSPCTHVSLVKESLTAELKTRGKEVHITRVWAHIARGTCTSRLKFFLLESVYASILLLLGQMFIFCKEIINFLWALKMPTINYRWHSCIFLMLPTALCLLLTSKLLSFFMCIFSLIKLARICCFLIGLSNNATWIYLYYLEYFVSNFSFSKTY